MVEIGQRGTAALRQDGGSLSSSILSVVLARYHGSVGTYELISGTFDRNLYIADNGEGRFIQRGGTATITRMSLGERFGSEGTYEMIDGTLTAGSEYVGGINTDTVPYPSCGTGKILQTGGTHTVTSRMYLGLPGGTSLGIFELHGGSFAGSVTVGYEGTGRVLQTGGTLTGSVSLGSQSFSDGSYDMQDGALLASFIGVGSSGNEVTAQFSQSGGGN